MRNIFLLTILVFSLTSCRWFTEGFGSPFITMASFKLPNGSPAFQAGYKDGCNQIYYSRGNSFYRALHKYHYDTKMSGNKEYRFGYKRGISYCFNTVISGTAGPVGSADKYIFPVSDPANMTLTEANGWNAVTQLFGGLKAPGNPTGSNLDSQYEVWSGGSGGAVFTANPLWAGGSKGQFFGQ